MPRRAFAVAVLMLVPTAVFADPAAPEPTATTPAAASAEPAAPARSGTESAPAAPAAEPPRIVRHIEFVGLKALPAETVRYYLDLKEGQPLDERALDRNLRKLWDHRLVDDVRVEKIEGPDGLTLRFTIAERSVLRSIDYKGIKRVTKTEINERIAKDQIAVREGEPLSLGELQRLASAIESMYRDKGFRFAQAKYSIEEISPSERRVLFSIDEAERVRIGRIRFEGNRVYSNFRLRLTMKKTKQTNLFTRLFKKDIYNPANIQEDLDKVRDLYHELGYKDVIVDEPKLSVLDRGGKRKLALAIPVDEGKRWKLGEITIEGNHGFSDQALLKRFRRPRGGWLRSKAIDDGIKAIDEAYRNHGHIFAEVKPELKERDKDVADLIVHVAEGDPYRVGRMEFQGNTRTRDKVLRREFRVQEGTLLNMGALKNSLFKVNQLGYFKLNDDDPILFQNFDSEKKTVDLVVQGDEKDRTELQVGGGWSETYGFFGQVEVKTQNFLGRGESVGVSVESGSLQKQYNLSYTIPWWLDRPQTLGFQLFKSDLDYTLYTNQQNTRKQKGGALSYGRAAGLFSTFSVSLSRSDIHDLLTSTNAVGVLTQERFDIAQASLRPAWGYDSRDSLVEPTQGKRVGTSLTYAGGFLGGQDYFIKPEASFSLYAPVTRSGLKTVFGMNLEGGIIRPFGGHALLPLDLYVMGGEQSVRGFQYGGITVRCNGGEPYPGRPAQPCRKDELLVDNNGFFARGDKYFQLNLEYHFLVGGPFRLIAFLDAGNVYGIGQSYDFNRLRYSGGVEFRIFVPVFGAPLRFIFARNLRPLPQDRFDGFQFSIGATF